MNHAERYEYLVNKMAAIRWRGSDLDASYYAALFLMASHPTLFQKMDRYLCPEGIDFTKMMRKEEFEYDWMKITADAARNLFSWNSKCAATPFEISRMPAPAIRALFTACFIANGDYMVSVRENNKGEKVFEIDDSAGKRREAFNLQMEQMMKAPVWNRTDYGGDFLAVDPLTAKILAKVAMQAATDSESRKRILFMILAPVLGLLLLIAFILYLITSPFSVLSQWLIGDEVNVVEDFQKQYGYNQQLGIYEKDYIDGSGQSYEGVIFTDGATEVVYYNQLDERWADLPYGTDNIGGYGCGPTSMAIVVSSLTDQTVDPPTMAEWAYQNGYWCSGNGSYHSLIPGAAEGFGLQWESISTDDPQAVVDALASGKLIVALMSKGHFTSSGHFMVLRGVTSEGKILVADPASKKRSEQEWDISIILDEARKGAAAGGPLWAIY